MHTLFWRQSAGSIPAARTKRFLAEQTPHKPSIGRVVCLRDTRTRINLRNLRENVLAKNSTREPRVGQRAKPHHRGSRAKEALDLPSLAKDRAASPLRKREWQLPPVFPVAVS